MIDNRLTIGAFKRLRHSLSLLACVLLVLPQLSYAADEFVVRDMRVEGLQRISEGTVFNYLPINVGDTVDRIRVQEAIRALYEQALFISGPISIARFAGDSAEAGINYFLKFLAVVSISLGIINLFPIPILDGGQIVYQTIEWLKGSPLLMRWQVIGQQAGILALLILMSFAFYNDIARLFG